MRPLIIDDLVKEKAHRVMEYARTHTLNMDDLLDIYNKQEPSPGDREGHVMIIPMGFRVVFSFENQNGSTMRHLSVSVAQGEGPARHPNPVAVQEIMKLFGFKKELTECIVEVLDEPIPHVSIIEP